MSVSVSKFATKSLLVLPLLSPVLAIACGNSTEKPQKPDRSWIKNDTVIYGAFNKGKIFKTRFDTNKIEILTDHHLDEIDDVEVSPDKRYLLYTGEKNKKMMRSYYIYDTKTGKESYISPPKVGDYLLTISPDSTHILLMNGYVAVNTLYVYNIIKQTKSKMPFPVKDKDVMQLDPQWSENGRYIYIEFSIKQKGEEFYKYNLATGVYQKIEGKSDSKGNHFIEDGHEVEVFYQGYIWSQEAGYRVSTVDKNYIAYINKDNNLVIKNKSGIVTLIQKGGYPKCGCGVISVVPIVWLNGKDNYLIYRSHGLIYIYGVKEKRKSLLFDSFVSFFDWKN